MGLVYHVIIYETKRLGEETSDLERTRKVVASSAEELARIVSANETIAGSKILGIYARDTSEPNRTWRLDLLKRVLREV